MSAWGWCQSLQHAHLSWSVLCSHTIWLLLHSIQPGLQRHSITCVASHTRGATLNSVVPAAMTIDAQPHMHEAALRCHVRRKCLVPGDVLLEQYHDASFEEDEEFVVQEILACVQGKGKNRKFHVKWAVRPWLLSAWMPCALSWPPVPALESALCARPHSIAP